jgi:hypothetical protein
MQCSRIIWLGDLNYRVSLSYEETKTLLEENEWDILLEKDQVSYQLLHMNRIFQIRYSVTTEKRSKNTRGFSQKT